MDQSSSNPPENQLPAGLKEAELISSITTSGFPLQGVVAHKMLSNYQVIEEWSYIDRDTQKLRSLDVFAFRRLDNVGEMTPYTALLIECKSSIHPYVFFQNAVENPIRSPSVFPTVCGLRSVEVRQRHGQGKRYLECKPISILGLTDTPFGKTPSVCSAFTQAIADGQKVRFSGTDPFNSIVMPLVKANDHAVSCYGKQPGRNETKALPTLVLNICAIDAPIVLVEKPNDAKSARLEPWVRILRQEAKSDDHRIHYSHYIVDVVHRGFLNQFFSQHVEPFLTTFRERLGDKADVLCRGGVVGDLDSWTWQDVSIP